jgi:hypothetical protein
VWRVKEKNRGHVKRMTAMLITVAVLSASLVLAEDFKTINGKEYNNATVNRVEPDGIVLKTKSGISKVYFAELPKEVHDRFVPTSATPGLGQRQVMELKSWVASIRNPTSFVLLLIGAGSLIAAAIFAIVRTRIR